MAEVSESPKHKGKTDFEETLFGPKGIESLVDTADRLNISGKPGDEIKDLKPLLCFYADFFHRTFPKMTRQDVLLHLLKHSNKGLHHILQMADDDTNAR
uniref:Chromosome segregation in meiosis protein 3 domain-containing protein n=1 Tax=Paramoeba aestuarina TaxID=180227 RepID=A0A7S4KRE0_9EUKA